MTPNGFYRGKQIIAPADIYEDEDDDE